MEPTSSTSLRKDDSMSVTLNASTLGTVAELTINWSVEHFSFRAHQVQALNSPSIRSSSLGLEDGHSEWTLVLTPKIVSKRENEDKEREFVALHLRRETTMSTEVPTRFCMRILNEDANCIYRRDCVKPVVFAPKNQGSVMWGWDRFVAHEDLFDAKKKMLVNDVLILQAKVSCLIQSRNVDQLSVNQPLNENLRTLQEDMSRMYADKKYTDFLLVSKEGIVFHVHAGLLISRSEYFRAMLTSDYTESNKKQCILDDLDRDTLDAMLEYLYSGTCSEFRLRTVADKLLIASDKYCVKGLKELSEHYLSSSVNASNAANLLILSDKHSAADLKLAVKSFLVVHLNEFIRSGGIDIVAAYDGDVLHDALSFVGQQSAPKKIVVKGVSK